MHRAVHPQPLMKLLGDENCCVFAISWHYKSVGAQRCESKVFLIWGVEGGGDSTSELAAHSRPAEMRLFGFQNRDLTYHLLCEVRANAEVNQ